MHLGTHLLDLLLVCQEPLHQDEHQPGQEEDDSQPGAGHGGLDQGVRLASLVLIFF